jgi:hypothetical protein
LGASQEVTWNSESSVKDWELWCFAVCSRDLGYEQLVSIGAGFSIILSRFSSLSKRLTPHSRSANLWSNQDEIALIDAESELNSNQLH